MLIGPCGEGETFSVILILSPGDQCHVDFWVLEVAPAFIFDVKKSSVVVGQLLLFHDEKNLKDFWCYGWAGKPRATVTASMVSRYWIVTTITWLQSCCC